jgi:hypothetical protein
MVLRYGRRFDEYCPFKLNFTNLVGTLSDAGKQARYCARIVHEWIVFNLLELAFERKQIPRFVGNVSS